MRYKTMLVDRSAKNVKYLKIAARRKGATLALILLLGQSPVFVVIM